MVYFFENNNQFCKINFKKHAAKYFFLQKFPLSTFFSYF